MTTTAMTSRYSSYSRICTSTTTVLLLLAMSFQLAPLVEAGDPEARIVGGQDASFNEYQFFTSWGRSCGATLIHDDILLTAAHCNPVTTNQVIVGAYAKGQPMINSEIRNIERRIMHPDYNVDSWDYDVMLLKLTSPVTTIPKVALNNDAAVPQTLSTVTPLGLGRLQEVDGKFPHVLQEVNVRVIDSQRCNQSPMYSGWIQESMICAGVSGGGQDACFGDSGGPLIQTDLTTGDMVQVGVVSFGTGCARRDKPGVYHRVSSSYDWIQEQICTYSSNRPSTCAGVRDAVIEQPNTEGQLQQEQEQQQQEQQKQQEQEQQLQQQQLDQEQQQLLQQQQEQQQQQLLLQQQQQQQQEQLLLQQQQQQEQEQLLLQQQQQQEQEQLLLLQQQQQQQEIEEKGVQLFTHPENPPPLPLGMCEGDCDKDSDCSEGLFCFYKTNGVAKTVPGCEGSDTTSTDFCVDMKYRNSVNINSPVRQSILSSKNGLRGSSSRVTGNIGQRKKPNGIIQSAFGARIP